jgi:hypothetical protein
MPGEPILEFFQADIAPDAIDAENGVIRGVKFLGEQSANPPPNHNYYPRSTRERAVRLLEGSRINVNHPQGKADPLARPYEHGLGVARNVKETGTGLHGDFHFNPKHPLASQILWDAQNAPQRLGFSINAFADSIRNDGQRKIIEGISEVYSIDLVSRPATTRGLFEGRTSTMKKPIVECLRAMPRLQPHLKLIEDMYGDETMRPLMGQDAEVGDEMSADEAGIEAMCTMLKAAAREGDWAKAQAILKAFEKLLSDQTDSGECGADGDPTTEEAQKAGEQDQLKKLQEQFQLQLRARDLAADAGVKLTKNLRRAFDTCKNEKDIEEVVQEAIKEQKTEDPKPPSGLRKPVSSSPSHFNRDNHIPGDAKPSGKVHEARSSLVAGATEDEIQRNRVAFFRGQ